MRELDQVIAQDTQRIDRRYINLLIDSDMTIYRARFYCYELYHQMRCLWPADCPYILNGEVDKRGHPILRRFDFRSTPDFLIHSPGRMAGNHAVIEVKPSNASQSGVIKDLESLSKLFIDAGYERAIYLMYDTRDRNYLIDEIHNYYCSIERPAQIEIWLHARAGEPAELASTLSPDDTGGTGSQKEITN